MTQECSIDGCSREVFKETGKCALHCEKHSYSEDLESGLLEAFYNALIQYIADNNKENLSSMDIYSAMKDPVPIRETRAITILFNKIHFPARVNGNALDYCNIIKEFGDAEFEECEFVVDKLEFVRSRFESSQTEVFFKKCIFNQIWEIDLPEVYRVKKDAIYKECTFKDDVRVYSSIPKRTLICTSIFNECSFNRNLVFNNFDLSISNFSTMFNLSSKNTSLTIMDCTIEEDLVLEERKINSLLIKNSEFKEKVFLNNLETDKLVIKDTFFEEKVELNNLKTKMLLIEDTVFKKKFELREGDIGDATLDNTNFEGLFQSYGTTYKKFFCFKSIFEDFVGFEDCSFFDTAKFEYVTFESFTNFRSTKFMQGLDLKTINLKEYPNFLNVEIKSDKTNRETFRIIKHSFDKIGNHIEANKFFAREMSEYKRELTKIVSKQKSFIKYIKKCLTKKYIRRTLGGKSLKQKLCGVINFTQRLFRKYLLQERFIFWFNEKTSNFGQSYFRPIGWILLLSLVYSFFGGEDNANETKYSNSGFFNGIAKSILPLKRLLGENISFINLLFYIIFAILIWLTIVAVKRHTRR